MLLKLVSKQGCQTKKAAFIQTANFIILIILTSG